MQYRSAVADVAVKARILVLPDRDDVGVHVTDVPALVDVAVMVPIKFVYVDLTEVIVTVADVPAFNPETINGNVDGEAMFGLPIVTVPALVVAV